MDNREKTTRTEQDRINLNEDYEVQYWASRFHVSQDQLKQTIQSAGTDYTKDVEQYLKQHTQQTSP
jgi:hypothetical protein